MFPELTDSQFQVLMFYALGSDSESTADILKCSKNAVKLSLRRIKENMKVEKLDTVRIIYHSRVSTALLASDDFSKKFSDAMNKRKNLQHLA